MIGTCKVCGTSGRVHRHHHDYSKPTETTPVCLSCHRRIHAGRIADPATGERCRYTKGWDKRRADMPPLARVLRSWLDGRMESPLSRKSGVPLGMLRGYLSDRYSPRVDHLMRIALACGRTADDVASAIDAVAEPSEVKP